MKRRTSARPVVVETKNRRPSNMSAREVFNRGGTTQASGSWVLALDPAILLKRAPRSTEPTIRESSSREAQPVRRVLPALMPVSALSEPEVAARIEPSEEPAQARPTRRRRQRAAPINTTAEVEASPSISEAGASLERLPTEPTVAAAELMVVPAPSPARTSTATRRGLPQRILGPGERWKRRLPRSCW